MNWDNIKGFIGACILGAMFGSARKRHAQGEKFFGRVSSIFLFLAVLFCGAITVLATVHAPEGTKGETFFGVSFCLFISCLLPFIIWVGAGELFFGSDGSELPDEQVGSVINTFLTIVIVIFVVGWIWLFVSWANMDHATALENHHKHSIRIDTDSWFE